ncbi:MAG: T9SS type A sorting domain-containing protein [Bacteroidales bacterium]|jgi:1,4-alpha-glucan branching enzyme|nr:T9SS type A sorting domain-containing protein [Bacteroidales bacterium]
MITRNSRLIVFLIFSLIIKNALTQVVTTIPEFPTADQDSVIVIFDATKGDGGLANVPPPIYAHTGVITNMSTSPADWKYVIADWSTNTDKALMTPLGNNLYQLVLKPTVRGFYNVPENETILRIAFVFRNSDGSRTGRESDGSDIFYDIYPPGLNVSIQSPVNGAIYEQGQTVDIQAVSNMADSMFLYVNSELVNLETGNNISYGFITSTPGTQWIKVIAKNEDDAVADSVYCFVRGEVPVAPLPAGVVNGINYMDENTVTLVLHDPPALKQYAFVIGDFNNWMVHDDFYMNRTPDGQHFWLMISDLQPGQEYIYQYYINGELRLADPYCEKVSDPWNDKWISGYIYPDLIPYPTGKTTGIASVLQTGQSPYDWEVQQFTPPPKDNLIIYELHIRDFLAARDVKVLTDTLDYLQNLGVNAIELMPINEFEGNDSWGYNPSFYFATDKAYGRKQDYQKFIDECHKRGIAVILDMVFNHSYGQSPLVQMYFNPYAGQYGQPSASNPWYNQICPHEPWCWGYDFNHLSVHTQNFIDRANAFWLTEFKADGFRFDFTKGFTNVQTGGQGWNYDAVRISILKRMADKIREVNPDAYIILEHFTDNAEEKELAEYGMMIWGNMHGSYRDAIRGTNPYSNFNRVSYKARNWSVPNLIGYMESHDEERQMYENLQNGNKNNPEHNIRTLSVALKRMELAAMFFYPVPGPKMLWQFGELGYDVSINYNGRVGVKPVKWEYYSDYRRKYLYDLSSELIRLKKEEPAFSTTDFVLNFSGSGKSIQLNHETMNVVVVGNFSVQPNEVTPGFQHTGWWYDHFKGDSINVSDINMSISMGPGEYCMFADKLLATPQIGTGISEPGKPGNIPQMQVLFERENGNYHILVEKNSPGVMTIHLLDLSGRVIKLIADGEFGTGAHEFKLRADGIIPGVYIIQINSAEGSQSRKVLIY